MGLAAVAVTSGAGGPLQLPPLPPDTIATNHRRAPGIKMGKISPMAPLSIPSFILGLHVLQGIVAGMPSAHGTTSSQMDKELSDSIRGSMNMRRLMPRKRQLNPKRLLRRLGKDFDTFWMSKDLPTDFLEITTKRNKDTTLIPESQSLDISSLIHNMYSNKDFTDRNNTNNATDSLSNTVDIHQMSKTLQSWLVEFSSCSVYYQWQDLGLFYWPRWVRKGMCSYPNSEWNSDPEQVSSSSSSSSSSGFPQTLTSPTSCSWPPGMHCIPNRAKKLRILRWDCRPSKDMFHRFRQSGRRRASSRRTRGDRNKDRKEGTVEHGDKITHGSSESSDDQDLTMKTSKSLTPFGSTKRVTSKAEKEDIDTPFGKEHGSKKYSVPPSYPQNRKHRTGIHTRSRRSRDDDTINKTEDWSKGKWKGRRRKSHVRCRWVRIPYPVTDDCYCSC